MAFEQTDEIGCIGKSHLGRNLPDVLFRFQQEFLRVLHLAGEDILYGSDADDLSKTPYKIRFCEARPVGKTLDTDGLMEMALDKIKDWGDAGVAKLLAFTAVLDEIREDDFHQPPQLHTLVIGQCRESLGIIAVRLVVEEGFGTARGQIELGIKRAVILKKQLRGVVGVHL